MRLVRRWLSVAISAVLAVTGVTVLLAPPAAAATSAPTLSGVRMDALKPSLQAAFATWRGAPVGLAHEFLPYGTWADIEAPSSFLTTWSASAYGQSMLWSVGMLPKDSSTTLAAGAAGAYDEHWKSLAKRLVGAGMGSSYVRIGWEMNGTWYRWSAGGQATAYTGYFRRIVETMRSVEGADFRFVWCPNNGKSASAFYPGDDVVDVVGVDAYDQSWVPNYTDPAARWTDIAKSKYGLDYWASFAANHGKRVALPEWGVFTRPDGHGGGDAPYYVQRMHDWIGSHDVEFETYFNRKASDGDHYLGPDATAFPRAAAKYRELWSATTTPQVATPAVNTSPVQTGDEQSGDGQPRWSRIARKWLAVAR